MAPGGKGKDPADQPSIRTVRGDVDAFFKKVSGQPGRPDRSDQYPARTVSR